LRLGRLQNRPAAFLGNLGRLDIAVAQILEQGGTRAERDIAAQVVWLPSTSAVAENVEKLNTRTGPRGDPRRVVTDALCVDGAIDKRDDLAHFLFRPR
jgi:hypothetical protein